MLETLVQRWKLRRLIAEWCLFRDLVFRMRDAKAITPDSQQMFLANKAKVASRLSLVLALKTSPLDQEKQRHVEAITELLNRYRTLNPDPPPTPEDREEFDAAWHQEFIYLNTLKGVPAPKTRRAQGGRSFVPSRMHRPQARPGNAVFAFLGLLLRLGVITLVIYLLVKAVGLHTKAGHIVASPPTTAAGVGRNVLDGLHSLAGGFINQIQPVVHSYGPTAAIVLGGVLLLSAGYLIFVRS